MKKRVIASFLLILVFFSFVSPNFISINAAINESYGTISETSNSEIGSNSVLLEWTAELVYTFAASVERIGSFLVRLISGEEEFPWVDKVIFNTMPILDINFINPSVGSFFMKAGNNGSGEFTALGKIIRNIYFTVLSISLAFITLLASITGIKLAISSMASQKAKYKEMLIKFAKCLVLIFGLHYLLAFLFFANEKLVESASEIMNSLLSEQIVDIIKDLNEAENKDNKALVKNFVDACNAKCFIEKIPIIGDIWGGLMDLLNGLANLISGIWKTITGSEDDEDHMSEEQLGAMYPNKDTYVNAFKDNSADEKFVNVAAYLLKNRYYRNAYLQYTHGTDTNSFSADGVDGVIRNVLVTANDIFGVVDTGYKSLRSLYTSTMLITFIPGDGRVPYETANHDSAEGLKNTYGEVNDEELKNNGFDKETQDKQRVNTSGYYSERIHDTESYREYIDEANKALDKAESQPNGKTKEGEVMACTLNILYANAYYKYVFEGDKEDPHADQFLSNLGHYFKTQAYYVDIEGGGWAPDNINVVAAMLYGIFVIQSFLIFVAYVKRFFYVVILSVLGPIVVVYDYGMSIFK